MAYKRLCFIVVQCGNMRMEQGRTHVLTSNPPPPLTPISPEEFVADNVMLDHRLLVAWLCLFVEPIYPRGKA